MPAELITPGIYIDEVMPSPPAVNEVETAIPAFIGYTEKAVRNGKNLFLKPCVVQSLAEFVTLYVKNAHTHFRVLLDSSNAVSVVRTAPNR